jgi:hypothetical protein
MFGNPRVMLSGHPGVGFSHWSALTKPLRGSGKLYSCAG